MRVGSRNIADLLWRQLHVSGSVRGRPEQDGKARNCFQVRTATHQLQVPLSYELLNIDSYMACIQGSAETMTPPNFLLSRPLPPVLAIPPIRRTTTPVSSDPHLILPRLFPLPCPPPSYSDSAAPPKRHCHLLRYPLPSSDPFTCRWLHKRNKAHPKRISPTKRARPPGRRSLQDA